MADTIGNIIGIGISGGIALGTINFIDKKKKQKELREATKGLIGVGILGETAKILR